jgi:hypothetical protein
MDLNSFLKPIVNFFGGIRFYWFGFILWGDSHIKIKGPHMRQILDNAKPGDLILRRFDNYLSSWFIKGRFSHIGLYVGDNYVIHVGGHGILKEDILTFVRADDAAILRPVDIETVEPAIKCAYEQLAKDVDYDFLFDSNSPEHFYCSEFTDYCYGSILKHTVSGDIVYPDDYLKSSRYQLIWEK